MGVWSAIRHFFGFDGEEPLKELGTGSDHDNEFVTSEKDTNFAKLMRLDNKIRAIGESNPEKASKLKEAAADIKELLLNTSGDNPEVDSIIEMFGNEVEKAYIDSEGRSAINALGIYNSELNAMFRGTKDLDEHTISNYKELINGLKNKIKEAKDNKKPILEGYRDDYFTDLLTESKYRLSMVELLYRISINPGHVEKFQIVGGMLNPFKNLVEGEKLKFPSLFMEDLKNIATDYNVLYDKSKNASRIKEDDKYNRIRETIFRKNGLDEELGIQKIKDPNFVKMFNGDFDPEKLFKVMINLVLCRYYINQLNHELEIERKNNVQAMIDKMEREEAERKQREKDAQEREELANLTNEEIEQRINNIYNAVGVNGSVYVKILDMQKKIASAKGLLPASDELQEKQLACRLYSPQGIISFIDYAKKLGINYMAFPDSQEAANGGFYVFVSESDKDVFKIPSIDATKKFKALSKKNTIWRTYGTVSSPFLRKILELFYNLKDWQREDWQDFIYADIKDTQQEIYEIGIMDDVNGHNHYDADDHIVPIIKEANKEFVKELRVTDTDNKQVDDYILSYISIPATYNIIPLLQSFQNAGIDPYFERVPNINDRNTMNRDFLHIYFYRKDYKNFWNNVRPTLMSDTGIPKTNFSIHYDEPVDFNTINISGLNPLYFDWDRDNEKVGHDD